MTDAIHATQSPLDQSAIDHHQQPAEPGPLSRRWALRGAAALAAGGAVAAVATTKPAAAADGSSLILGSYSNTSVTMTGVNNTSTGNHGARFLFQSGTTYLPTSSAENCALAGWAADNGTAKVGIYGYSGQSDGTAMVANAWPFAGQGVGLRVGARTTHLRFTQSPNGTPDPRTDSTSHQAGDITFYSNSLWVCIAAGTPGTWRQLAGAGSGGNFHPISMTRVYDSRTSDGLIAGSTNRVVSVAAAVPAGATAITGNLTITGTVGAGNLALMPGDAAGLNGSTTNWYASGQTVPNSFVSPINAARQVKIFADGPGKTQFIVDVTGYYM